MLLLVLLQIMNVKILMRQIIRCQIFNWIIHRVVCLLGSILNLSGFFDSSWTIYKAFWLLKFTQPILCFWIKFLFVTSFRWIFILAPIGFFDAFPLEKLLPCVINDRHREPVLTTFCSYKKALINLYSNSDFKIQMTSLFWPIGLWRVPFSHFMNISLLL